MWAVQPVGNCTPGVLQSKMLLVQWIWVLEVCKCHSCCERGAGISKGSDPSCSSDGAQSQWCCFLTVSCRSCMETFLGPGSWPGIPVLLKGGSCRHLRRCVYLQSIESFWNRLLIFWSFKGLALILSSSKRLQRKTINQVLEQNY